LWAAHGLAEGLGNIQLAQVGGDGQSSRGSSKNGCIDKPGVGPIIEGFAVEGFIYWGDGGNKGEAE
jgi:hypothetical protein